MRRPLLLLAGGLALGAAIGGDLELRLGWVLLGLATLALLLALAAAGSRAATLAVSAAAVAIGAAAAVAESSAYEANPLRSWLRQRPPGRDPLRLEGVARGDVVAAGERHPLTLELESWGGPGDAHRGRGRVRIEIGGGLQRFEILDGDRLVLWATLDLPRAPGSPGTFDAASWARHEGLAALGFCKSPLLVSGVASCQAGAARCAAARFRRWARGQLGRFIPPGPQEALARALVLGDRSGLDEETNEAFRRAGTYHILAISGAQVALVAGLLLLFARRIEAPPGPTACLVSILVGGYALIVGGDVPVVRAALLASVLLLGRAVDLEADLANLLGLAAILLLAHRPSNIFDVGFQLSFGATLAIALLAPPLLVGVPRLPLRLEAGLAASIAAQLALAPLLAHHFHRLAPAALLLNLAAVPLSGAVLVIGLAVLALSPVAALAAWAGDLAFLAADALLRTSNVLGLAAALDVRVGGPGPLCVACACAGCTWLVRGRRGRGLLFSVAASGLLLLGEGGAYADGRLELAVLDVGQGDGLLLRSPNGRVLLVDAGGTRQRGLDMGEAVVAPFLWQLGQRHVDAMILTHAHPDHVGGVPFLLGHFPVAEVWEGVAPLEDPGYQALDRALRAARISRVGVARGVHRSWEGAEITVLGPRPRTRVAWRTQNDDSVVLAVRFGEVCFLLTGDIESRSERELGPASAAVLKVPHHGSRTSSTVAFLHDVSPLVGVVSVGQGNPFGHPHAEVLERYASRGVRLYRTDRDGTVRIFTDGRRIWVSSHRGGAEDRVR